MNKYNIGIIGIGFVGGAMMRYFINKGYRIDNNIFVYDKYKNGGIGTFDAVLNADILFLTLPTMYNDKTKVYDKSAIMETCDKLRDNNYKGAVVIKSTVEPQVGEDLCLKYNLNIIHNPEFLTARTAYKDFRDQKHIVLGMTSTCDIDVFNMVVSFYKSIFPNAELSTCNSTESESMKIFINCFYSVKIQFMNELYLLCQSMDIDYNNVKNLMLKNGWINPMHTIVPGTDGQLSYGGLCFPKDTNALQQFMKLKDVPHEVLSATVNERNEMRNDSMNILK